MDEKRDAAGNLKRLIIKLNEKYKKQVVVLIDEYDKPILDLIEKKREAEDVEKNIKRILFGSKRIR